MNASVINNAAAGITADILFSSLVFWIFMYVQYRKSGPNPFLFIALNLLIGLSCALPAYLYVCEDRNRNSR
jgi:preprotein translocase subunit SecD